MCWTWCHDHPQCCEGSQQCIFIKQPELQEEDDDEEGRE